MQFEDWSNHLLQFLRLMPKLSKPDSVAAALAVSEQLAASRPLEFLRPAAIKAFGGPVAPAQFGNAVFAAKSVQVAERMGVS